MPWLRACITALLLLTAGCAYNNNIPYSRTFIATPTTEVKRVFADSNGTFYPTRWDQAFTPPRKKWKAGSLLAETLDPAHPNPAFYKLVKADETRQLDELERFMVGRKRLFILVHGINNDEEEARDAYRVIRTTITPRAGDGIIEFYWDGLVTRPPKASLSIAPARFWFDAAAYSKVVGARGLRRILARARDKDIHLISHSRGAAVILSALSDMPQDAGFVRSIEALDFDPDDDVAGNAGFLTPPPLADHRNRYRLIFMAAAIGCVDFRVPGYADLPDDGLEPHECKNLRPVPPGVMEIRYTLNPGDPALGKYLLPSKALNPTDFGLKPELGRALARRWPLFPYCLRQKHGHPFALYVADPELAEMLEASGVKTTTPPAPTPPKSCEENPLPPGEGERVAVEREMSKTRAAARSR